MRKYEIVQHYAKCDIVRSLCANKKTIYHQHFLVIYIFRTPIVSLILIFLCCAQRQVSQRLGSGPEDGEAIKKHMFFKHICWNDVVNRKLEPPFKPILVRRKFLIILYRRPKCHCIRFVVFSHKISMFLRKIQQIFTYLFTLSKSSPDGWTEKRKPTK